MSRTSFSLEVFGDKAMLLEGGEYPYSDNSRQIEIMKRALKKAMKTELTECQHLVVNEFFFNQKSVTEIAKELCVNKSTVSRHLKRAKEKLGQVLKYGLYHL